MTQKAGVAYAKTMPPVETLPPLAPSRTSAGMKLVKSALNDGQVVSTRGLSREDYVARLKGQSQG